MSFTGGSNGQWVRARNPESAKAFLAERQMEEERRAERLDRVYELLGRAWRGIRRLFARGSKRG